MSVATRLTQALEAGPTKQSRRAVHREIQERGGPEASYSTTHRYFSGETEPPLGFIEVAAEVLDVEKAWLAFGDGPMRRPEPSLEDLAEEAAHQLAVQAEDPQPVIHAFYGAMHRLYDAIEEEGEKAVTKDQVAEMAELLVDLVKEPLRRLRHTLPLGSRQVQDHYIAQLHALTLIMPPFRSVESMEVILEKLEAPDATD